MTDEMKTVGARERGELIFYDERKGFGFIRRPGQADLFVGSRDIVFGHAPYMVRGAEVELQEVQGKADKPRAANVRVVGVEISAEPVADDAGLGWLRDQQEAA